MMAAGCDGDGGVACVWLAANQKIKAEARARKKPPKAARNPRTASGAGKFMLLAMSGRHGVCSSKEAGGRMVGVGIDFVRDPIVFENDGEKRA